MTTSPRPRVGPATAVLGGFGLVLIVATAIVNGSPAIVGVIALVAVIVAGAARGTRPSRTTSLAEPNELRVDRVERSLAAFFDRVDRLPGDDLDMLAVQPLDASAHRAAVARATDAVSRLHRTGVLARVNEAIDADLPRRLSASRSASPG
jgi:hypothetical protein